MADTPQILDKNPYLKDEARIMNARVFIIIRDYPKHPEYEAGSQLWPYLKRNQEGFCDYPLEVEEFSVWPPTPEPEAIGHTSIAPVSAIFENGRQSQLRIFPYAFIIDGVAWVKREGSYRAYEVYSCPEPARVGERYACRIRERTGEELAREHYRDILIDVTVTLA
jgi:hypothetical protein